MGGKGYYCDYCECYMKNDVRVRKKHIDGLSHKIEKAAYLAKYRNPHELLAEESAKAPCSRFHFKGNCKFGLFCHFSHYTPQQISELKSLVSALDESTAKETAKKTKNKIEKKQESYADIQSILHWKVKSKHLPISLRPIRFSKLTEECLTTQWG